MGRGVRLPCVNHSADLYTTEAAGADARAMRIGLMQVRRLRQETIEAMLRERENGGVFRSLEDFLRRVPTERDEIESLIKCGAFDEVDEAGEAGDDAARAAVAAESDAGETRGRAPHRRRIAFSSGR